MHKYKLEGGVDFYTELSNTELSNTELSNTELSNIDDDNAEVCNITGENLLQYNVTLICGHKFNYESIYNEVKSQKLPQPGYNYNKSSAKKLSVKQMKCPLCRNIQPKILPWIPSFLNCPKIYGVNSPPTYSMYLNRCNHNLKSGKKRGEKCNKVCNEEQCKLHIALAKKKQENNNGEKNLDSGCLAILKSGANKGKLCGCRIKKNTFCNRHCK
jgi:hypothetical protein